MSDSRAPLGVALTGHRLPLEARVRLAARAEALGFELLMLDGDAPASLAAEHLRVYDPTAVMTAAALATRRIRLASIHLAHLWQPALLARQLATLHELSGGRLVSHFGVGTKRAGAAERIARLDQTLGELRPLLARARAETPIAVSAAGPRALEVVRRHADVWDANVPPLPERLAPLRAQLGRALPTWIWVFARPGAPLESALADYRRHAPWFRELAPDAQARAVLHGDPARCRARLAELRRELDVALPIVDLAGLDEPAAARALEALAKASDPGIS
ncbi:MAG TPA: LLM class flavin-dependent oxidoreductase [Myxococcota bacterium]|nr:LLM class flavin-dependent oxidoreductase [Myxococcota bacterium]